MNLCVGEHLHVGGKRGLRPPKQLVVVVDDDDQLVRTMSLDVHRLDCIDERVPATLGVGADDDAHRAWCVERRVGLVERWMSRPSSPPSAAGSPRSRNRLGVHPQELVDAVVPGGEARALGSRRRGDRDEHLCQFGRRRMQWNRGGESFSCEFGQS